METPALPQSEPDRYRRIAPPLHMIFVLVALGAWAYFGMIRSEHLRAAVNPHRIPVYARTILIEWLMFAFVILGVKLSGSPLRIVLGERWHSVREVLRDIGIATVYLIGSIILISILSPHGHGGGTDPAVQFILPHGALEIALWIVLSITAGICEESIYRGYLQQQFIAVTKSVPIGIVLSAAAFGASHAYQGFRLAILIGLEGAMLGILANWRRSVRPGMIAHASKDVLAVVIRH